MLVAGGRLTWTPDVVQAMYWSFNTKIDQIWSRDNASQIFDIDEGDWDRPARADLVDAGAAPAFVKEIEANVRKTGNVYGTKDAKGPVGKADVLYVVDDTTRAKTPEIAEAMKKILKAKGVDFAVLAKGTDGWGCTTWASGRWRKRRPRSSPASSRTAARRPSSRTARLWCTRCGSGIPRSGSSSMPRSFITPNTWRSWASPASSRAR